MRLVIAALLAAVLAGCSGNPTVGHAEGILATSFVAAKFIREGSDPAVRKAEVETLAMVLENASLNPDVTGAIVDAALAQYEVILLPEDRLLVNYLQNKLAEVVDLELTLTPEQREILAKYAQALRDGIELVQ